ncbi:MAG: glycosyltransferase family 9 protein [Rhodanobacteraceae bacterium]
MHPIVIRFGRIGDMLLLAPLLDRLHRGYGTPSLLLGTGPWSGELYVAHPDVARVVQVTARHRPLLLSPERWHMLQALRSSHDAPVHVCECEPRALAKINRMLALAHVAPNRCVFLTDAPALPDEHWIDRLLRACGQPPPAHANAWQASSLSGAAAPRLLLREHDRHDRDAWLRGRGWRGEPIWLVQPCNKRSMRWNGPRDAADDDKAWPAAYWMAVLRAMRAAHPDARILVCGAPDEAPVLEAIVAGARLRNLEVAASGLSLRRLIALAEIAQGMLSVDTGPAHIAAAMGCPLVVLFGAQSPAVWRPRSPTSSAVIALGGPPQRARIADIAPDEVISALRDLPPREPELPRAA